MDFKKAKKVLNKEMHPAWVWVLAVTMGVFSFISYNYLFEPSYMPAPFVDFSKRVVNELILGDKDWRKTEEQAKAITPTDSTSSCCQNSGPTSDIDTSTWQTYKNKELGFSIKYPEGWSAEIDTDRYSKNDSDIYFHANVSSQKGMIGQNRIFIKIEKSYGMNKDIDSALSGLFYSKKQDIQINGIPAVFIKGSTINYETEKAETDFINIFMVKNNKLFTIGYVKDLDNPLELKNEFEKIYQSIAI